MREPQATKGSGMSVHDLIIDPSQAQDDGNSSSIRVN